MGEYSPVQTLQACLFSFSQVVFSVDLFSSSQLYVSQAATLLLDICSSDRQKTNSLSFPCDLTKEKTGEGRKRKRQWQNIIEEYTMSHPITAEKNMSVINLKMKKK